MSERIKYPRTLHLPWSLGVTNDDKITDDLSTLISQRVVVTEKLDGENTTIYSDGSFHARSLDGRYHHATQMPARVLAELVTDLIPKGWRLATENVYIKHSIQYSELSNYIYVFAIYNDENFCLSWTETEHWVNEIKTLGKEKFQIPIPMDIIPKIYVGEWDEKLLRNLFTGVSHLGGKQEGYVVRTVAGFPYDDFSKYVTKFVRKDHVQTDTHWRRGPFEFNKLRMPN